uniref:Uncharacterized protein n=1 Tax=Arundo donax TaxID=35708 RepID=A0A0A8XS94_ARUDO
MPAIPCRSSKRRPRRCSMCDARRDGCQIASLMDSS